jgi:hypothetical protein
MIGDRLAQYFSLFSHKVHFGVYPDKGMTETFSALHFKIDRSGSINLSALVLNFLNLFRQIPRQTAIHILYRF